MGPHVTTPGSMVSLVSHRSRGNLRSCLNLFTWEPNPHGDLSQASSPALSHIHIGTPHPWPSLSSLYHVKEPPNRPVQTCSLCSPYIYRQMGGWPSTEGLLVTVLLECVEEKYIYSFENLMAVCPS